MLFLVLLSPGIPEYLTGSSTWTYLVVDPGLFFLLLALNLGLYGPGVLLMREVFVRGRKGWAAILCLGSAYGLLEEGTALSTIFNPHSGVLFGGLGSFGHWGGVNWLWVIVALELHVVLSIGVPILLFGLALPEMRWTSLLDRRDATITVGVFVADIAVSAFLIGYFRVGLAWQLGALAVAAALIVLAYRLPRTVLQPTSERPRWGPWSFFALGLLWFPNLFFVLAPPELRFLGAPGVGVVEILTSSVLFLAVRHGIGRTDNARQLLLLALGLITPLVVLGLLTQLFLPIVLVEDVVVGLFFYALGQRYRLAPVRSPVATPAVPP